MSRPRITPEQRKAIEVLEGCRKLEKNLRNLRAVLVSRGQWKAAEMLDKAWEQFAKSDLQIETTWPNPERTAADVLRLHDHTHLIEKESL